MECDEFNEIVFMEESEDSPLQSQMASSDSAAIENEPLNLNTLADAENTESNKETSKCTKLPMHKVKSIMKMDPDVNLASKEAIFVTTKFTELFIQMLAKEAYHIASKAKRKLVTKRDLDMAIQSIDCLYFLEGAMDF